jgi:hypothetical protein
MAERAVETFDVRIERGAGEYVVVADSSYGGTYRATFGIDPAHVPDVADLQRRLQSGAARDVGVGDPTAAVSGDDAATIARRIGGRLFDTLFVGELRNGLRDTMTLAQRDGRPLRLRLRLDATPELAALPWELLRDDERDRFLAVSSQVQVVRHLGRPEPVRDVALDGPLRVLVVVSSPSDLPPLAVEREWQLLVDEVQPLVDAGRLELRRVEPPTFEQLGRELLDGPWHVFHFIGHGEQGAASLAFCDAGGRADPVSADALAVALADSVALRLAVLNACHTAEASGHDAFGGVAHELLEHSLPAVVAMQFAISDAAAVVFAGRFYAAISHGWAVDRAVGDARTALYRRGSEWATPVVHLRGDGVVFDVGARSAGRRPPARRRRAVAVGAAVLVVLAVATTWALVRRDANAGDDDDGGAADPGATELTGCPTADDNFEQLPIADRPSGQIALADGTIDVRVRALGARPDGPGWLVLVVAELHNATPEEISVGEWYVQELVVARRPSTIWCFDPGQQPLDADRTVDVVAGFEVTCEPVGRIELIAGESRDVPIAITPDPDPSDC